MQNGFYSAAGGMVAQFSRLDNITNNLANLNTNGYKREDLVVGDFLRLYQNERDNLPLDNQTKEGAKFIHRTVARVPQVIESYRDMSVGAFQNTGNTFDMALKEENLFFAVLTPDGIKLTKDGAFTLNDEGILSTKQGHKVLSSDYFINGSFIEFGTDATNIELDKNGKFSYLVTGNSKFIPGSELLLVEPENVNKLKPAGDNLLTPDQAETFERVEGSGAVFQGALEKSNVNAIKSMVGMIEAQRLVGMYQKVMDTQMNEMNRDAIDKIANSRA
ncbi:flagellar hook-basal body protein [Sulfurimonas sp. MAG313]|nr:flagellar hook-basal body protein [Sulfurimonas sp. MAG313]MDF1881012.1 flagellar hook-basal body protein [Sulfurimonas sp. MAG313]